MIPDHAVFVASAPYGHGAWRKPCAESSRMIRLLSEHSEARLTKGPVAVRAAGMLSEHSEVKLTEGAPFRRGREA